MLSDGVYVTRTQRVICDLQPGDKRSRIESPGMFLFSMTFYSKLSDQRFFLEHVVLDK